MELTGLGDQMAVGKRGRSIRRLPTRTLNRISKANVYWVPCKVMNRTGTLGWGGQRGYNPNHTATCIFQAMSLAQGCVHTEEGVPFATGYSCKGAICSLSCVSGDFDLNAYFYKAIRGPWWGCGCGFHSDTPRMWDSQWQRLFHRSYYT